MYTKIKSKFSNSISSQILQLSVSNSDDEQVKKYMSRFLAAAGPATITGTGVTLTETKPGREFRVTGTSTAPIMGFTGGTFTLLVSAVSNDEIKIDYSVEHKASDTPKNVFIPATLEQFKTSDFTLKLSITGSDLKVTKAVRLKNAPLNLDFSSTGPQTDQVKLAVENNQFPALSNIDKLPELFGVTAQEYPVLQFIPTPVKNVLSNIKVNDTVVIYNRNTGEIDFFEIELSTPTNWSIIPSKLTLNNIGVKASMRGNTPENRFFNTQLYADTTLGSLRTKFYVEPGIGTNSTWKAGLAPSQPQGITFDKGWNTLFDLAGVPKASVPSLPQGLDALKAIELKTFEFDFSLAPSFQANSVSVALASNEPWVLIPNFLTLSNFDLFLQIAKSNNKFQFNHAAINAIWRLGKTPIQFSASTDNSKWRFDGSLLAPVNFSEFLKGHFNLPSAFPDIELETANIHFETEGSKKTFHIDTLVDIKSSHASQFPMASRIGGTLDITHDPNNPSANTKAGSLTMELDLGVTFNLSTSLSDAGLIFSGAADGNIALGGLLDQIGKKLNIPVTLPDSIKGLTASNVAINLNFANKEFDFTCTLNAPHYQSDLNLSLKIEIRRVDGKYTVKINNTVTIGKYQFNLLFEKNPKSKLLVATFAPTTAEQVDVKQFVATHLSASVGSVIPPNLLVGLKDIIFVYDKDNQKSKFFLGFDLTTGFDLSSLPLVGKIFTENRKVSIDGFRLMAISGDFQEDELTEINTIIESNNFTGIPTPKPAATINITGKLNMAGSKKEIGLPIGAQPVDDKKLPAAKTTGATLNDTNRAIKWMKVQKSIGPFHWERVGIEYKKKERKIYCYLDASLSAFGLTLDLQGLGIGSTLDAFNPSVDLHGLGVEIKKGNLEIAGSFLRNTVGSGADAYDEYDGSVVLGMSEFKIMALGSYAKYKGHTSMFIYAAVNAPLGGPVFFFLEGLAAGIGYNRSLTAPPLNEVAQFPLVAEVVGTDTSGSLTDELVKLRKYIKPQQGEYFGAVGVKFSSFKIIDSFALITLSFGKHFELDVFAISTLVVPPEDPKPLAEVQMAVKAVFAPDEGVLGISAILTPSSYIFSKDCILTGGFAFYSWFKDIPERQITAGDFVYSLGGYHPRWDKPKHYPNLPRVGFNWNVSSHVQIKGGCYYALTGSALMAGGFLDATWHSGALKAWFKMGADFLMSWKPYHYDISAYVEIGVSYTFHFFGTHHIHASLSADLQIWGPEFAGKAHVKLWIISFTVRFGAGQSVPKPISWNAFKSAFLPKETAKYTSIRIKDGLIKEENDFYIANPKTLNMAINSVIPINEASVGATSITGSLGKHSFGIAPMAKKQGDISSKMDVSVSYEGSDATAQFKITPIKKAMPAGVWGSKLLSDLSDDQFIKEVPVGFEITPKTPVKPSASHFITQEKLLEGDPHTGSQFNWNTELPSEKISKKALAAYQMEFNEAKKIANAFGINVTEQGNTFLKEASFIGVV